VMKAGEYRRSRLFTEKALAGWGGSFAANVLSNAPSRDSSSPALVLIADRTFTSLEAVAQRILGLEVIAWVMIGVQTPLSSLLLYVFESQKERRKEEGEKTGKRTALRTLIDKEG
jgi:hypothetical protein